MKTKILALGFSLAFLIGNAVFGEVEKDPKGPIYTLEPLVVYPHVVKLLNDQKLEQVDFEKIIRCEVEEIAQKTERDQISTMITFALKEIYDIPMVAAAEKLSR